MQVRNHCSSPQRQKIDSCKELLYVMSSTIVLDYSKRQKEEEKGLTERDRRLARIQWETHRGRGRQSLTLRKIDKEPGWPPVCLSLVLLLAPSLSATGRISLLIHSTRLQHLQPSPSSLCLIVPSLMCPVCGNLHRPALCPTWMGAEMLGASPWSSFNSKGMFGLKEDGWGGESGGFWSPIPSSIEENVWQWSWHKIISQRPQNKSVDFSCWSSIMS